MTGPDLAALVERYPITAVDVYDRLEGALNLVLPGSDTHKRYRDIAEVGLALVVGPDLGVSDFYNPFDPASLDRLSFKADNQPERPDAWTPQEIDEKNLGGVVPFLGRFMAYAMSKLNELTFDNSISTSVRDEIPQAKGRVGLAGGRRIDSTPRSLVAASGLWEIHDHLATGLYYVELSREVEAKLDEPDDSDIGTGRVEDDLAADLEPILAKIYTIHEGVEADQIERKDLPELVAQTDQILVKYQRGIAA